MIFLNIIDLVAINYDSIRFLLSWVTPVWGSLKFINSENQNEKHHDRVLNVENFYESLTIDEQFGFWTVRCPRNVRFNINLVGYIRRDQIYLTLRIFR